MKTIVKAKAGFTILELVVVVTILAVLASAAFLTLEEDRDQQRYETTRDRYDNIRKAIIGQKAFRAGTLLDQGFLSDTGYFPGQLAAGGGRTFGNNALNELITNPPGATQDNELYLRWGRMGSDVQSGSGSFGNGNGGRNGVSNQNSYRFFVDNLLGRFELFHGWRGPYLDQNVGETGAIGNQVVLQDDWNDTIDSPFVYFSPLLRDPQSNKPNLGGGMALFSLGKFNEFDNIDGFDPASANNNGFTTNPIPSNRVQNSSNNNPRVSDKGFHLDYPATTATKFTGANELTTDATRIPPIRIRIRTELLGGTPPQPDPNDPSTDIPYSPPTNVVLNRTFIGVVYPGMSLTSSFRDQNFVHPSLDLQPRDITTNDGTNFAYQGGRRFYAPNGVLTSLGNLRRPLLDSDGDPSNGNGQTVILPPEEGQTQNRYYEDFILERTTNWPNSNTSTLSFNKPQARRYQIVLHKINNDSPGPNVRLATTLLGVHPQVFYFSPGTSGAAVVTRGSIWVIE